jgi:phage terminase small subunit
MITDRDTVLKILQGHGNDAALSQLYADAYIEYAEAMENIRRNGAVCASPRTGAPIENPYLRVRDKALAQLLKLRRVKAGGLW